VMPCQCMQSPFRRFPVLKDGWSTAAQARSVARVTRYANQPGFCLPRG
jgi:hypothetical protein